MRYLSLLACAALAGCGSSHTVQAGYPAVSITWGEVVLFCMAGAALLVLAKWACSKIFG